MATVPKGVHARPTGSVVEMIGKLRSTFRIGLTPIEQNVGVHLRGNASLMEALIELLTSRILGRANVPVPSDPLTCKSMMERDAELRFIMNRLRLIYDSPANESGEQPAA